MANAGIIQYDVQRNWTVTNDNAVGATADVTLRGNSKLPHPLARSSTADDTIDQDNDVSTIYLDPANGNDANTGTDLSSDAVLTKVRAEALVTATRFTIHIERTDALTTTTFSSVDAWTPTTPYVGASFFVQVASGQTATMVMDGVATTIIIHGVGKTIHGFIVTSSIAISVCGTVGFLGGLSKSDFCTITAPSINSGAGGLIGSFSIQSCKLFMTLSSGDSFLTANNAVGGGISMAFDGNILAITNYSNAVLRSTALNLQPGVVSPSVIGATLLTSCTFNTFYNIGNYIHFTTPTGTPVNGQDLITGSHENNIISKCDILIVDDNLAGNVLAANYDMDWVQTLHGSAGLAVLGANVIEELSPLFRDVIALDFTPAHVSDSFNGEPFPISSPAIDAADDGTDLGAIQRTFTEIAESSINHTLIDCGYMINEMPTRINYQQFDNIQGAAFDTWDDVKNEFIISLSKDHYVGHVQATGLDRILRSKLQKRFYPNGILGMLDADLSITVSNDTDTNIVTCTVPQASTPDTDILPRWFIGWVIKLDWSAGANIAYYQITNITTSGTDEIVTAELLRGDTLGATTPVDFNIMYMPIIFNMKKLDLKSDFYNSDIKTWLKDSTTNQVAEFHTTKIVMKQSQEFLDE